MTAPGILLHTDDPDLAVRVLSQHHPDIRPAICDDYDGLADAVARHQPQIVYSCRFAPGPFPRDALMQPDCVRWVSNAGSGVNHLAPWDPGRVTVTNTAGVAAEAMAHYAIGGMLHFALDVPGLQADQTARVWRNRTVAPLTGRTLLIVGLGKTGMMTGRFAHALGMRVIGVRARPEPTPPFDLVRGTADLPDLMGQADYILVCLPLLDSTRGLVGARALAGVRKGAVLVDISRGGIVETPALIDALDDGRLKGAVLDVFEPEPLPDDSPLWSRTDVLISPHCSGVYDGWEEKSMQMFCQNLTRWRAGEPLQNVVDPDRGY